MNLIENILTNSDCYKAGQKITVRGLMIHSVGCPQPKASAFMSQWNTPGVSVCAHAIAEAAGDVYQTLPWDHRGWHAGGAANNIHIGVELTEPATITYTGGANWVDNNPAVTREHVLAVYAVAVELFADLCMQFNLDPLADGVIISHSEGYRRGTASNHGDVEHLWGRFGLMMEGFRADVERAMHGVVAPPEPEHWAEPYWRYLNDNGVTVSEKRYDDTMRRGEAFVLLARVVEKTTGAPIE